MVQLKEKIDDVFIRDKLGSRGKDAQVYSCSKTMKSRVNAIKVFRKNKNPGDIKKEYDFLKKAYKLGISPKPILLSEKNKYIIMEMISDKTLYHYIKKHGKMTNSQQKDIIEILEILDGNDIFHGDISPSNFMLDDNNRMFIIDFGMSKIIDDKFEKKNGKNSNLKLGLTVFILKIREIIPDFEPKILLKKVKSLLNLKR